MKIRVTLAGAALFALSGCLAVPQTVEEARSHSLYSTSSVEVSRSPGSVLQTLTGQRAQSCFSFTLQRSSGGFGGPISLEQENFRLRRDTGQNSVILERVSSGGWYPYGIVDIASANGATRATITMQSNDLVFRRALESYIRGDTSSCPKNSPML